ncbi:NAD(P)/FAD-dependent oxidoreductase [Paracoccus rhizosphaerae]|uniref:NAD(P)/FAD-dependent oxidoreductase n=1 Tax=Paracoccus rhizosphaerae TaxID=1133347 RepID=A0ABV6CN70_9RHOB|nr:FAD-dependent oxidoreductase [Paracoccus rhizosphaerae]
MDDRLDVAIIGAGITGITCARKLQAAGLRVRLFDKSRGAGGRLATRRTDGGLRFDHGAQYLQPRHPDFKTLLEDLRGSGQIADWDQIDGAFVGTPGMSQLPRALSRDLDIRQGAPVTQLVAERPGWRLGVDGEWHGARRVVLAIPAPQARDLLGQDHAFAAALRMVHFQANITVMIGLDPAAPRPFVTRKGQGPLAWIAQDSAKPGRGGLPLTTWVVQADPEWSMANIDLPFDTLADRVAPLLLRTIGAEPDHLRHKAAHRWLYARADQPLGHPFLSDDASGVIVGGDWTLGLTAEDGWTSGRAMAAHLLAT